MNGNLNIYKKAGKVSDLKRFVIGKNLHLPIDLDRTLRATHGEPSYRNSHPHTSGNGSLAIIHNGITENYSKP